MGNLLSVIVPVYKVEDYLRECLNSIINQTYRELEIILVDDGSPDKCGEICEEYAKNDRRVKVFHKENGGLSDARNYGMAKCNGDFIMFVDSDDVLKNNCAETLMDMILRHEAEIAAGQFMRFTDSVIWEESSNEEWCFSPHDMLLEILYQRKATYSPWGKIYRREIFSGIEFPKGMYYEDAATVYKLVFRSTRIVATDKKLYGYRMRPGSILKESFSPKMLHVILIMQKFYSDVTEKFPDLKAAMSSRAFSLSRNVYLYFPFSARKEHLQVWAEMKKYRSTIIFDPHARKHERLAAMLSYLGADIFHILLSWLYRRQQMMKL